MTHFSSYIRCVTRVLRLNIHSSIGYTICSHLPYLLHLLLPYWISNTRFQFHFDKKSNDVFPTVAEETNVTIIRLFLFSATDL